MRETPEVKLPSFSPSQDASTIRVSDFLSNEKAIILDIRTPAEFEIGHIEGAHNLPLFTNEERAIVGTIYKQQGKDLAVEKGLEFVGPKLHSFVAFAKSFGKTKPFYLYCWRGGMRSRSMAWLLSTAGMNVSLLEGGYKGFRSEFAEQVQRPLKFITLLGPTGVGKTELLDELEKRGEQVLNLENLANHKGSAFGGLGLGKQPSTEEFINRIHHKLRKFNDHQTVWVEGESMMIGSCFIPNDLYDILVASPFYMVEMEKGERIERLTNEYGSQDGEQIKASFAKITKRMGYDRTKEAIESFENGNIRNAVELALNYYDRGYKMASEKRTGQNLGSVEIKSHNHATIANQLIEWSVKEGENKK